MGDTGRLAVSTTFEVHAHEPVSSFHDEVSSVRGDLDQLSRNVSRVSELRSRSTGESVAQPNAAELEELVAMTSELNDTLKRSIQTLEGQTVSGSDGEIRRQQTRLLKSRFVEEIKNYQAVEPQYRQWYGQLLKRRCRILKPGATTEEIRAILDDAGGQALSQIVLDADRLDEAHAAYRGVQENHKYLQQVKRNLAQLAHLSDDMGVILGQYEPHILEEPVSPVRRSRKLLSKQLNPD